MKNFISILFFLTSYCAFAQTDWIVFNTSNSGIPHNVVEDITIDASGNTWVATYGGVGKFDGSNWTVFNTSNTIMPSNVCYSIKADADTIWIGTVFGLVKFDGTTWTNYPYGYVLSMGFEANGTKWFGGYQTGLVKYDGTTWTSYNSSNSILSDSTYYSVAIDSDNNKWFASVEGVFKFDDIDWTRFYTVNSDLPGDVIFSLSIDANDTKWLSIAELGIGQFDGVTWTGYDTLNSDMPENYVNAEIAFDDNGDKWIGTSTKGLTFFDDATWTTFNTGNSGIPSNNLLDVVVDAVDNKWIGTYGSGLAVYRENGVILYIKSIEETKGDRLFDHVPNPSHDLTTISYALLSCSDVEVTVIDGYGKHVADLVHEDQCAGSYSFPFQTNNLSPGVYSCVLKTETSRMAKKLIIY